MQSPFAIFRKHARPLTVVLTLLAMFAFIIMGNLRPEHFPALAGCLLGASLFWLIGRRMGKPSEYAIAGAVLGTLIGVLGIGSGQMTAGAAVQTSIGNVSSKELGDMMRRRQVANQFLSLAFSKTTPEEERRFRRPPTFSLGRQSLEEDVVQGYLLRHLANEMGIEVSDDSIDAFIKRATSNKLSVKDFISICRSMQRSEDEVFAVIRDELKSRMALELSMPRMVTSPEEYWQFYERMNVRQQLDVAAIPVEQFVSEIEEPSPAELVAFFDQYKADQPNQKGPGTPGFFQQRKVRVGYLEADYETIEGQLPEVTDDEVVAYYKENKETLYRNRPLPDADTTDDKHESNPLDPEFTPESSTEKKETGKKKTEKKSDENKKDKPEENPSGKSDESGKNESEASESDKDDPGKSESKSENKDDALKLEEEEDADSQTDSQNSGAADDAGKKDSADKAEQPAAKDNSKDAVKDKDTAKKDDSKPKKNSEQPADNAVTKTDLPVKAPKPRADGSVSGIPQEPLPEYRPLDDDLKSVIRDQLLRERTLTAMKQKIKAAAAVMYNLGEEYAAPLNDSAEKLTPQMINKRMVSYAKENGLRFVTTELLTGRELATSEDYPIGSATEPGDTPFDRQNVRTVIEQLFGSQSDQLYMASRAEDMLTSNRYAYWKIEDVEAHVPTYDEPGVDEQVLKSWKETQARPKAEKRAERLAEIARDSGKPMAESLDKETVTGKSGGLQLSVRPTESFSWLRQSSAPQSNPFNRPPPVLSTISAIDRPGPDFMETVFDRLSNNEVGVAPNADQSIYYVVQVRNRIPSTPGGQEALRQAFLKEDLFFFLSPYVHLVRQQQQQTVFNWSRDLFEKYAVRFNQDAGRR